VITDKLPSAILRWHHARLARNAARKAMSQYLADAWGEPDSDDDRAVGGSGLPHPHKYACCGLGKYAVNGDPYDPAPILCDVCTGSKPLYLEMLRTSKAHGAALRGLQGVARTLAKKPEDLTCHDCEARGFCPFAWDAYNTNGDCLAEK
jgi:hypothetical protein